MRAAKKFFASNASLRRNSNALPRKRFDPDLVTARAVCLATDRTVAAIDGSVLRIAADTLSVHGDTPGADQLAAKIRAGLNLAGIVVKAAGAA